MREGRNSSCSCGPLVRTAWSRAHSPRDSVNARLDTPPHETRLPHIVFLATDSITAFRLLHGQLKYLREHGFDVTVVTAPGEMLDATARREGVRVEPVRMQR